MNSSPKQLFPILIAEDDPVSRKLLGKALNKAGYEVVSVENGRKALDLLNEKFFPIVLTDWMMPEIDGLELCRCIRENVYQGYIFIILLTANDSIDDIVTGLKAGADDYLTKPFNRAELIARLNSGIRILELERFLKDANEKIRKLSITDPLTGSYNREYLNEHFPKEVIRARRYRHPLSLVLCDIDHFKDVNDTYGHQAGDQVLKEFVQCINESIRGNLDWVARYGGEEFLITLPETDFEAATQVAERLRRELSKKVINIPEKETHITASFGVTGFGPDTPDEKTSLEVMIEQADRAMYQAKKEGRNRVNGKPL